MSGKIVEDKILNDYVEFASQEGLDSLLTRTDLSTPIREFFYNRLQPLVGKTSSLNTLNELMEVCWKLFVSQNMHFINSRHEFQLPLIAMHIINDDRWDFATYLLQRISRATLNTGRQYTMTELEAMYKIILLDVE